MTAISIDHAQYKLTIYSLQFSLSARTFIHLGRQAGAQIRGALWEALRTFACTDPKVQTQEHREHCPMCRLVALEMAENARGVNPPRPFVIRPPLPNYPGDDCFFYPGDVFKISINLFGDVAGLFPYIAQAMYRVGNRGIGYGRGQFTIQSIEALLPFDNESQLLYDGQGIVASPKQNIAFVDTLRHAETLDPCRLTLHFLTPTQLTTQGRTSNAPKFDLLIARLLERCQALEAIYTVYPTPQPVWRERYLSLTEKARTIQLVEDHTRWLKVHSGSRRSNAVTWISGFVGQATYEGDLTPFREWLLWGEYLHVGKNAVKGNGWYRIERP